MNERDLVGRRAARTGIKAKRPYSQDFTPHNGTGKRYFLDLIPAGLWAAVRTQAKRDGISVRWLILTLLTQWLAGRQAEIAGAGFAAHQAADPSCTCPDCIEAHAAQVSL